MRGGKREREREREGEGRSEEIGHHKGYESDLFLSRCIYYMIKVHTRGKSWPTRLCGEGWAPKEGERRRPTG